jgi:hypothetical protein
MTDERVSDERLRDLAKRNESNSWQFFSTPAAEAGNLARELLSRRSGDAVGRADAALAGYMLKCLSQFKPYAGSILYGGGEEPYVAACRAAREGKAVEAMPKTCAEALERAGACRECGNPVATVMGHALSWCWRHLQIHDPSSFPPCCDPVHAAAVDVADVAELHDRIKVNSPDREWSESDLRTALNAYRAAKAAAAQKVPDEAERIVHGWYRGPHYGMGSEQADLTERIRAALAAAKAGK